MRALHHYDEIGLLKPACVGANGYRYYGRPELLRLQRILFHRELGVPLDEIAELLALEGEDQVGVLMQHRERLESHRERLSVLIETIDRTIAGIKGEGTMSNADLYKGFSAERQAGYEAWLIERYGPAMRESIDHSGCAGTTDGWSAGPCRSCRSFKRLLRPGLVDDRPSQRESAGRRPDDSPPISRTWSPPSASRVPRRISLALSLAFGFASCLAFAAPGPCFAFGSASPSLAVFAASPCFCRRSLLFAGAPRRPNSTPVRCARLRARRDTPQRQLL